MDALVIGGGIIGGSIAWRLAQAGLRVAVLEAGRMGGEASWAGAGMLAPGGEMEGRDEWTGFALESLRLYPAFVAELEAESGIRIDYRACGAIEQAEGEAEWRALTDRAAKQAAAGIPSRVLGAGALFYPEDAVVDPRDVMRALRIALDRRGVLIEEGRAAEAIELAADEVTVRTPTGVITGGAAVLAAGAWSGAIPLLSGGKRLQQAASIPVRGHLLAYDLPRGSLGPILRRESTYILQRRSGVTIAGSSTERVGFERAIAPEVAADIEARAFDLFPALRTAPRRETWLGFRPATEDLRPRIGRFGSTRLWLAYGHYRNGILLAPATAARVAREITTSWETG